MTAVTLGRSATFPRSCIGNRVRLPSGPSSDRCNDADHKGDESEREPGIWSSPSDCRGHGRGKPGESKADLGSNGHSREPYAGVERP